MRRLTHEELLAKIDWEGGVVEAALWGIGSKEVPKEIEHQWSEIVILSREVEDLVDEVTEILEERTGVGAEIRER